MRASIFRVDSRVLGRVLAVALALTLTTGALAGCGSEDKPKADPSPTSKPSVPPGLDTTPPRKPEAAETKESAVEYGRYFALLVQHAVRIRNVRPVMAEALDQAKCTTCRGAQRVHREGAARREGLGDHARPPPGQVQRSPTSDGFEVNGAFEYPTGKLVAIDGSKKDTATGGPYVFAADLVWDADGSRWRVLDYTFEQPSEGLSRFRAPHGRECIICPILRCPARPRRFLTMRVVPTGLIRAAAVGVLDALVVAIGGPAYADDGHVSA